MSSCLEWTCMEAAQGTLKPCMLRLAQCCCCCCCREAINHQLADCGQFELWRKGEWVTKENTGYATGMWCVHNA